jgi:sugar/nucleoside kinase (ribokinase family)
MSLVIVGSIAFDTVDTPFGSRERIVGGSGTYCVLSAAYFSKPGIVAVVGSDFPAEALELMRARGIDISGLQVKDGKTFHWHGRYAPDMNSRTTVSTELNVFADFRPELPKDFRRPRIIYMSNLDPEYHDHILDQVEGKYLTAMDTIKLWIDIRREKLLREIGRTDILFVNDEEARLISGESNLITAGRALGRLGPRLVIVKKGEHGAMLFNREDIFSIPAHPCEHVIDPTGAGDSFAGAFLGYLEGCSSRITPAAVRRAAVYGSVLASFVIEDFGINRLLTLDREQVEGRFRMFKRRLTV